MAKLESNFKNMVLSLTLIALVASASLGTVYMLTADPIEKAKVQKQTEAIGKVLPKVDSYELREPEQVGEMIIHKAYVGEELIGAAVETSSVGFGGTIRLMVGFDAKGKIVNYEVLEQSETPGLGTKMVDWFKDTNKAGQNIVGANPKERKLTVSKDGGEVDAITAATISSRAFLKAVQAAYNAYMNDGGTDAMAGASHKQHTPEGDGTDAMAGATTKQQTPEGDGTIVGDSVQAADTLQATSEQDPNK